MNKIVPVSQLLTLLLAGAMVSSASAASAHWRMYRNQAAGYSVRYPPTWTAHKRTYSGGASVTTFTPPAGARGITITAWPSGSDQPGTDIPNSHCVATRVHGLPAFRCFNTIASSTSTEIFGFKAVYSLGTAGRWADYRTYNRLVNSFRLIVG